MARAGKAPWDQGYKRVSKRTQGVEWSLTSGWRYTPADKWIVAPRKPATRPITLYNGRTVQVPIDDYQDFIGYHKSENNLDPDSEMGKYIYHALVEQKEKLQHIDGLGHIELIEYSPTYQLLQVTFKTDGAVVVFFRVPKEVYSELMHLANSGATFIDHKGVSRHVLGKRFWDIVRIRGQRTGARYKFEYVTEGIAKGSRYDDQATKDAVTAIKEGTVEEDTELFDKFASNFLKGSKLDDYKKLKTYKDKQVFLRKAGIL